VKVLLRGHNTELPGRNFKPERVDIKLAKAHGFVKKSSRLNQTRGVPGGARSELFSLK